MKRLILKGIWPIVRRIKKVRSIFLPKWYEHKLLQNYNHAFEEIELSGIISMQDQFFASGGLMDRIKGIVSGYWLAKQMKLDFHVYLKELSDPICTILAHKKIKIIQDKSKLSFSRYNANPIVWYNSRPLDWDDARKKIHKKKQVHLYCNMDLLLLMNDTEYNIKKAWSKAYNEIFDSSINGCINTSFSNGSQIIGIHLRFIGLLGDFKDLRNQILPESEKKSMKDWCRNEIVKIKNRYNFPIMIVADSPLFLSEFQAEMAQKNEAANFIIDSTEIGHTALNASDHVFKKTVIDFNSLSKCKKVYQLRYGKMHNSDFSRYAAMVNLNDFELVENDISK